MNMSDLMQHARQFQEKMTALQQELGSEQVSGTAGGGMVTATFNGRSELLSITIEPQVVNSSEVKMLEDLVTAAVNDGLVKAKKLGQAKMAGLTGGMNIPGFF